MTPPAPSTPSPERSRGPPARLQAPPGRLSGEPIQPRLASPGVCACCNAAEARPVRLERASGVGQIEVCSRCLRSTMRRQADGSEDRNRLLLEEYAEENGLALWKTQSVFYVFPPIGPFADAPIRDPA